MAKLACFTSVMVLLSFAIVGTSYPSSDQSKTSVPSSKQNEVMDCEYTIYVKTSDIEYAGTDAIVSLALFDQLGNMVMNITNLKALGLMGEGYDYFERNKLDKFALKTKCLPIPICKIVLSHDNSGDAPGWRIDYVQVDTAVLNTGIPSTSKKFEINQWLSVVDDPYQLSVTKDECVLTSTMSLPLPNPKP